MERREFIKTVGVTAGVGAVSTGVTGGDTRVTQPEGPQLSSPARETIEATTSAELPDDGVEILTDDYAVSHVYASDLYSIGYGQGYVQARDRFFQMDLMRLVGRGESSKSVGPGQVGMDVTAKRDLYHESELEQQWEDADEQFKTLVEGFVDGVNDKVDELEADGDMPGEFGILGRDPGPWKPTDTVAVTSFGIGMFGVSGGRELENARTIAEMFTRFDSEAEAWEAYQDLNKVRVPDEHYGSLTAEEVPTTHERALEYDEVPEEQLDHIRAATDIEPWGLEEIGFFDQLAETFREAGGLFSGEGFGSNAIIVGGDYTDTGKPMLGGGPQMSLLKPAILHEIGLHSPEFDVVGAGIVGTPGVVVGRTPEFAWTVTTSGDDLTDTIAIELDPDDRYRYRWDGQYHDIQTKTYRHEPNTWAGIIDGEFDLSEYEQEIAWIEQEGVRMPVVAYNEEENVAWVQRTSTWMEEVKGAFQWVQLGMADDRSEFESALAEFPFGFNFHYVDQNDIAYYRTGKIPYRTGEGDPRFPKLPGQHHWDGYVAGTGIGTDGSGPVTSESDSHDASIAIETDGGDSDSSDTDGSDAEREADSDGDSDSDEGSSLFSSWFDDDSDESDEVDESSSGGSSIFDSWFDDEGQWSDTDDSDGSADSGESSTTSSSGWLGMQPPSATGPSTTVDTPQGGYIVVGAINPERGYVVNWNNGPGPGWLSGDSQLRWQSVHRVDVMERLVQELIEETNGALSLSHVEEIIERCSIEHPFAPRVVPHLVDAARDSSDSGLQAVADELETWAETDYSFRAGSGDRYDNGGMAIWEQVRHELHERMFVDTMGDRKPGLEFDPSAGDGMSAAIDPHVADHGPVHSRAGPLVDTLEGRANFNWLGDYSNEFELRNAFSDHSMEATDGWLWGTDVEQTEPNLNDDQVWYLRNAETGSMQLEDGETYVIHAANRDAVAALDDPDETGGSLELADPPDIEEDDSFLDDVVNAIADFFSGWWGDDEVPEGAELLFEFHENGDGTYRIENIFSEQVLQPETDGLGTDGASIVQHDWHSGTEQRWHVESVASDEAGEEVLVDALESAAGELAAEYGTDDPSQWRMEIRESEFMAMGAASDDEVPMTNRASYQQSIAIQDGHDVAGSVLPPSNRGHMNTWEALGAQIGLEPDRLTDQLDLYVAFDYKPQPVERDRVENQATESEFISF